MNPIQPVTGVIIPQPEYLRRIISGSILGEGFILAVLGKHLPRHRLHGPDMGHDPQFLCRGRRNPDPEHPEHVIQPDLGDLRPQTTAVFRQQLQADGLTASGWQTGGHQNGFVLLCQFVPIPDPEHGMGNRQNTRILQKKLQFNLFPGWQGAGRTKQPDPESAAGDPEPQPGKPGQQENTQQQDQTKRILKQKEEKHQTHQQQTVCKLRQDHISSPMTGTGTCRTTSPMTCSTVISCIRALVLSNRRCANTSRSIKRTSSDVT